ncbi:MAG: DUF4956 domain-containing protein [Sphingobacteriaceae bacterium]|jgi:Domain of unknown function (DUF4956)|nr:DUF4956 domain-containing protein [Sphingobacteriaceae bacterium]
METEIIAEGLDALLKISGKFGARLFIDMIFVILLLKFIYIKRYKSKDYVFTFFVFNIVIFSVAFLLNKVELSLGAAFGLFAVFGMLRYKTEEISIKDMTYLFLNIAIGLICAVTKIKGDDMFEYVFLIGLNTIIFIIIYLLESNVFMKRESMKLVNYEKIENIKVTDQSQLIADLRERTGINIHRVVIQKVDFLKDSAQIKIYYYE